MTKQFQYRIWDFYQKNKRDLPWRHTTDPYKIFVSEVMLQQTQASRVVPKYLEYIHKFPDFKSTAGSDLADILRTWSGLGYNRRARFLWESAQIITSTYNNVVPKDPKLLDKLPGIGKATAASIIVFSYSIPLVFIETNIRRVFIDYFWNSDALSEVKVDDKDILGLISKTLDKSDPRQWYFALMDYGSFLGKLEVNPNTKSAHYAKQSRFEGSARQVRGHILRLLLLKGSLSKKQLCDELPYESHNIKEILKKLKKDKLIKIVGKVISLFS